MFSDHIMSPVLNLDASFRTFDKHEKTINYNTLDYLEISYVLKVRSIKHNQTTRFYAISDDDFNLLFNIIFE